MSFDRPEFLWLLLLLASLTGWALFDRRRRVRRWRELAQRGRILGARGFTLLAAAFLVVLAIARPRFGPVIGPPLPPGHDVVLLIDTSRSMGAEDAVPNRLAVAVESAVSLVNALAPEPASRAAVVAFAGRGVLRCPLTENLGAVVDVLRRLQVGTIQPGGTDLGAALDAALDAFGKQEHAEGRSMVLFSDGEDLVNHWQARVDRLVNAGVIVHVVAIGDTEHGHPVPGGKPDQPLTFEGKKVLSKREDLPLEDDCRRDRGGSPETGSGADRPGHALPGPDCARRSLEAGGLAHSQRATEQFPLFLTTAMFFALAGCWPVGRLGPLQWAWARATAAIVLFGFGAAFLGAGQGEERPGAPLKRPAVQTGAARVSTTAASSPLQAVRLVAQGRAAYAAGRLAEALSAFESAAEVAPSNPVPRYNAAAALFQLERYQEALDLYLEARQRAGASLRTKIDYALGNTALVLGEIPVAVAHYDRCMASRATGPDLDSVRKDAAINRRFALEQAPPSVAPEGETESDQASGPHNRPPGAHKPARGNDGPGPEDESTSSPPSDGSNPQERGETPPPIHHRRTGGGGGSNRDPGSAGQSPDDRLDDALDRIRDALHRRLPDEAASEPPAANRKDW